MAEKTCDEWLIEVMGGDRLTKEEEEDMWKKETIYRIPSFIKDRNKNTYDPIFVAIGPYHHGKPHLIASEDHKLRALRHFVNRSRKQIEHYLEEMRKVEMQLKESYEYLDERWRNSDRFLQMVITDGCFILEFMDIISGTPKDYPDNDPVFSYYGAIIHYNFVMRDLLLLENQLPYLALKNLLAIAEVRQEVAGENNVDNTLSQILMFPRDMGPGSHMLDIYMKGLFRKEQQNSEKNGNHIQQNPPSASELSRVGVRFKKVESFNEINFDQKTGILSLPQLNINDYTVSTFLNLKVFELRGTTGRNFNSYIQLMETLLKTAKDVRLLTEEGIIVNYFGSDEEVVKLMKELGKDIVVDINCKSAMAQTEATKFYRERMRHLRNAMKRVVVESLSYLRQNYFRTPWSAISVVAGTVLLVLTILQTIYTIKSYKQGARSEPPQSSRRT